MKKVLIVFGYKQREYQYLCLLKSFLQKKDFMVKIRYMNFECYYDVFSWKPDFVILNQLNSEENVCFAKYAKQSGCKIIILNAELLFSMDRICLKYDRNCNSYVDFTIEAGNKSKFNLIQKYSHLDREKIKMFGTPKFDPYMTIFRRKLCQLHPYDKLLDHSKKTICMCTSFMFSNLDWKQVKDNYAYAKVGKQNMRTIIRSHRKLQIRFIDLAVKIAKSNRYNIIFRVHPLEDSKIYERNFRIFNNIILDNFLHQSKLFEVVDLLIHRSSTIAIEAWIFDIPTITFDPINNKRMELFSSTRFEKIFHNINKIFSYIEKWSSQKQKVYMEKAKKRYLKQEFGFSKNATLSSSEKIAVFLSSISILPKKNVFHPYLFYYFIFNIIRIILMKKNIYEVLGLIKGNDYMQFYKDNYVDS